MKSALAGVLPKLLTICFLVVLLYYGYEHFIGNKEVTIANTKRNSWIEKTEAYSEEDNNSRSEEQRLENEISTAASTVDLYLQSDYDLDDHEKITNNLKHLLDKKHILNTQKIYINNLLSELQKKQIDHFKKDKVHENNVEKSKGSDTLTQKRAVLSKSKHVTSKRNATTNKVDTSFRKVNKLSE